MPGPCTNAAVLLLLGTYKYLEQICGGLRHVFERAAIPQARAQNARERRTGSPDAPCSCPGRYADLLVYAGKEKRARRPALILAVRCGTAAFVVTEIIEVVGCQGNPVFGRAV